MISFAQQLAKTGSAVSQLVPDGWTIEEAHGDLNKDGYNDVVLVVTPNFKEHLQTREDGYVYNFNAPILAIYFGSQPGQLILYKQYKDFLPYSDSEYLFVDYSLTITDRGVLRIGIENFSSGGSYGSWWQTNVYRYQDNDFFLIGKDTREMSRTTGEEVTESFNYLTHKCQRIVSNVFDEDVKPKETWKKIPAEPLQRLGEGDF